MIKRRSGQSPYDRWLEEKYRKMSNFDPSDLAPQFIPYFHSEVRLKVSTSYPGGETFVRFGTLGVTTGHKPVFLLVPRRTSTGSSDILRKDDVILAVKQPGSRHYMEVK